MAQNGITIKNFANAVGGVFYNGGVPYDSTGALLVDGSIWNKPGRPTYALLGDSIVAKQNAYATLDSVSFANGVLTCNIAAGHNAWTGARIKITAPNQTAIFGNSTATGTTSFTIPASAAPTGTVTYMNLDVLQDTGFMGMANAMMGGCLSYTVNAAVGGESSTQTLARVNDAISNAFLTSSPTYCIVHTGTNDIIGMGAATAAATAATIKTNLAAIYTALLNAGIVPIASTILPIDNTYAGYAATWAQTIMRVRDWMFDYCSKNPRILLFDGYQAVVNPLSATANFTAANTVDHVHPSKQGCLVLAQALELLLSECVPQYTRISTVNGSGGSPAGVGSYGSSTDNPELIDNALMTGTGGTSTNTAGGTVTGPTGAAVIPAGFTVQNTGNAGQTISIGVVPSSDGIGQDLIITFTSAAAGDGFNVKKSAPAPFARWNAGDVVQFETRVSGSGIGTGVLQYINCCCNITVSTVASGPYAISSNGTDTYQSDFDMTLAAPPLTVPASGVTNGTPSVFVTHAAAGTATYRISGWSLRKVQA